MLTSESKDNRAVVFASGGDQVIAKAISDGILDAKVARRIREAEQEKDKLRTAADFWQEMAGRHKEQVFEFSMRRIREAEAHKIIDFENPKVCIFVGFIAGVVFDVALTTLALCGCFDWLLNLF